jgi:hypothetical protein
LQNIDNLLNLYMISMFESFEFHHGKRIPIFSCCTLENGVEEVIKSYLSYY